MWILKLAQQKKDCQCRNRNESINFDYGCCKVPSVRNVEFFMRHSAGYNFTQPEVDNEIKIIVFYKSIFRGPLAQLVEQRPFKAWVEGSNPSRLTMCPHRLARPRTLPFQGSNAGSNPAGDAIEIKMLLLCSAFYF